MPFDGKFINPKDLSKQDKIMVRVLVFFLVLLCTCIFYIMITHINLKPVEKWEQINLEKTQK